jgi:hypothetical protein
MKSSLPNNNFAIVSEFRSARLSVGGNQATGRRFAGLASVSCDTERATVRSGPHRVSFAIALMSWHSVTQQ